MMTPIIDPHVHCRDWGQINKSTIKKTTELARNNRIYAIIDMPNTAPPIISMKEVDMRIDTAHSQGCLNGYYLNVGLTKDVRQVAEAVKTTMNPRVAGLKFFTCGEEKDVLAIKNKEDRRRIYETLVDCDYRGVLTVHCEDENYFCQGKFNPDEPWTWNDQRPPISEVKAVEEQIRLAEETGFQGHLRIAHVSTVEAMRLIKNASDSMRISGEVTPHHLLYSKDDMKDDYGLDKKTNPPIRTIEEVNALWPELKEIVNRNYVLFVIGSDNAPHTLEEKRNYPYASGHQSIPLYSRLLDEMRNRGFSEAAIENLTYWNVKKIFTKIKE
jgi:dihydroorotase